MPSTGASSTILDARVPAPHVANVAPAGVILAGGTSSRFGAAKGLERVAGIRIVDRVAAALRSVTGDDLLLVANESSADGWLPGVPRIADRVAGGGGLSGLHAALAHLQRPVLAVAWDMPFVTPALLRELARRCPAGAADAAVPVSASPVGMEPFCACYTRACLAPLERALVAGAFGAAAFVRTIPRVAWLTDHDVRAFGDPARLFFSVNTRDDLERAEAMAATTQ